MEARFPLPRPGALSPTVGQTLVLRPWAKEAVSGRGSRPAAVADALGLAMATVILRGHASRLGV